MCIMLCHLIALNTFSGAIAAGIDAMKVYNDWPFYNGKFYPEKLKEVQLKVTEIFENKALANFNHRNFGYLTLSWTLLTFMKGNNLHLLRIQQFCLALSATFVLLQVLGGIKTIKSNVGIHEAHVKIKY